MDRKSDIHFFSNYTVAELWFFSIIVFWAATILIMFIDFAGEKWFGISWSAGPDLFPNLILGYPLALLQLFSAISLLVAGFKFFLSQKTIVGGIIAALIVFTTGAACYIGFALLGFWYQSVFMGRSI